MNNPARILVVDDNEAMRYSIARLLRSAAYETLEAATGEDCLRLARAESPDLILLDMRLPSMQGGEVLRLIKADPAINRIFVVHLSALHREPRVMAEALRSGADGYLAHPIENEELLARIDAFLRHKKSLDALHLSETRYRALFENNPQPVLVFTPGSGRILKANPAASRLYQRTLAEMEAVDLSDIQPGQLPECGRPAEIRTHLRSDGQAIPVEIATHSLEWDGHAACAMVVTDLTEHQELEQERKLQRDQFQGELTSLETLSTNRQTPVSAQLAGAAPLAQTEPQQMADLIAQYEAILELALEERIYRVNKRTGAQLRPLADRLVRLRAGPRDVIHIHYMALRDKTAEMQYPKARGYVEAGRLLLIELLGLVVAAYRLQTVREQPASLSSTAPTE